MNHQDTNAGSGAKQPRCTTPLCGGIAVMQEKTVVSWRKHQKKCELCYARAKDWRIGQWIPIAGN